jgi:hypothetical protein
LLQNSIAAVCLASDCFIATIPDGASKNPNSNIYFSMQYDESHFNSINEEVRRHLEDSETSKLAHWGAAEVYERRHKRFVGLPALLLSLVLAWILSSDAKGLLDSYELKWLSSSLPVILSLLVSVFSALGTFLNFNELAQKHRTTAENLNSLWRDCKNWKTDFPDATLCEKACQCVQSYRLRLNEINKDAPQIPRWAWKSVKKQRAEGSTTYDLERQSAES